VFADDCLLVRFHVVLINLLVSYKVCMLLCLDASRITLLQSLDALVTTVVIPNFLFPCAIHHSGFSNPILFAKTVLSILFTLTGV
jgi:hypothetical protein